MNQLTTPGHPSLKLADAYTDEWYRLHKVKVGASDAAAACGLSRYTTRLRAFMVKTGRIEGVEESEELEDGKLMETYISTKFEQKTGKTILERNVGMYQHPELEWMAATPDAIIAPSAPGLPNEGGEWKWTNPRMAKDWGEAEFEEVPQEYMIQVQHQMAVCGFQVVNLAVVIEKGNFKPYEIQRNDRLIAEIIKAETEFWERVVNNDPPPPNWSHPADRELVREVFDTIHDGTRVLLTEELGLKWQVATELREQMKEIENRYEALRSEVFGAIGNAYAGVLPGTGKMIRRKQIAGADISFYRQPRIDIREVKYDGKPTIPLESKFTLPETEHTDE